MPFQQTKDSSTSIESPKSRCTLARRRFAAASCCPVSSAPRTAVRWGPLRVVYYLHGLRRVAPEQATRGELAPQSLDMFCMVMHSLR